MRFDQIVTGAAGFVGGHLCRALAESTPATGFATLDLLDQGRCRWQSEVADIRSTEALNRLASQWSAPVVVHLAALAEVLMPFAEMPNLNATNVAGTINLLQAFDPDRIVFASSSAVYGSLHERRALPLHAETGAIGSYGASKAMGEIICREWASQNESSAVLLRFGNIIGPDCRGLIPYLVAHAAKYPDGAVPARLRGQGKIVRDYVAVDCAVEAIVKAATLPLQPGSCRIFNIGSGFGLSNGEVARAVAEVLAAQGFHLNLDFDNPIPVGESESIVLDTDATRDLLEISTPTIDSLMCCLEQATLWHLNNLRESPVVQGDR